MLLGSIAIFNFVVGVASGELASALLKRNSVPSNRDLSGSGAAVKLQKLAETKDGDEKPTTEKTVSEKTTLGAGPSEQQKVCNKLVTPRCLIIFPFPPLCSSCCQWRKSQSL